MSLNHTLKIVNMANFVLYILYHVKKSLKKIRPKIQRTLIFNEKGRQKWVLIITSLLLKFGLR